MFQSDSGITVPAVTSDQMRQIDRIATEETGPNLLQMMENAGSGLASCTVDMLGAGWRRATVLVLAGSGGNGGGGLCAARHLANRGINITVCTSNPSTMSMESSYQRRILLSTNAREGEPGHIGTDLVIDALIGYGLKGLPRGRVLDLIKWVEASGIPTLSLDMPSGVDATTGEHGTEHIKADRTLTLALPKTGLTSDSAGEIYLADLGIPHVVYDRIGLHYQSPFDSRSVIPLLWTKG